MDVLYRQSWSTPSAGLAGFPLVVVTNAVIS